MLENVGPMLAQARLTQGKLAAIFAGALALGLVFALYPLRANAATRADVLVVGMALVAQGLAYAALTLGATRGRVIAPLASLLALPLFAFAGLEPLALAALGTLAVLEAALCVALLMSARQLFLPLAALLVPALVALCAVAPHLGVIGAGLVLVLAPLVAFVLPAAEQAAPPQVAGAPLALPALLAAALAPEGRALVVTDAMGVMDGALNPAGTEARFPGGSLTEAALIADRVSLLQALAQAAREGVASRPITLRLREGHFGAGYPTPPHFETFILRAYPLPEYPGLAGVLIEPQGASESAAPEAPVSAAASPALLAKALHDGIAPFNAGLGFLEMVADPRLAPRDFTALHDFTAEAHKAMCEAHRNTVLLGQWMRLTQDETHALARGEASPRRLLTEALRFLNIEELEKRGDLLADTSFDAARSYTLPINGARFALAVLLRFGMGAAHADLSVAEEGGDLTVTLHRKDAAEHHGGADAFQQALEQAAGRAGDVVFEAAGPGARRLRLRGAALSRRTVDSIRLAS